MVAASWQAEVEECLNASQEEVDQVEEAEQCRSSTSDDEESESRGLASPPWWCQKLMSACSAAIPEAARVRGSELNLKRVISGCTGCGAEIEVFKAPTRSLGPCPRALGIANDISQILRHKRDRRLKCSICASLPFESAGRP